MTILLKRTIKDLAIAAAIGGSLLFGVPALERMSAPVELGSTAAANEMSLSIFDVGQGDALLAQEGEKQILIDGGPSDAILEKLGNIMPPGDRHIELVILTHPHSDHVAGLAAVLKRYSVGRIMKTDVSANSLVDRNFEATIKEKGIPVDDPKHIAEEQVGDMRYGVLHSEDKTEVGSKHSGSNDGLNDSSIVGMLVFKNEKFLLTGDATTRVEDELLAAGADLKADFLKIGHHGSAYSSGEGFVAAVAPAYAAISLGAKNTYGFPAWRVLQMLKNKAIAAYRTDRDGTITVVTDGQSLQVSAERLK